MVTFFTIRIQRPRDITLGLSMGCTHLGGQPVHWATARVFITAGCGSKEPIPGAFPTALESQFCPLRAVWSVGSDFAQPQLPHPWDGGTVPTFQLLLEWNGLVKHGKRWPRVGLGKCSVLPAVISQKWQAWRGGGRGHVLKVPELEREPRSQSGKEPQGRARHSGPLEDCQSGGWLSAIPGFSCQVSLNYPPTLFTPILILERTQKSRWISGPSLLLHLALWWEDGQVPAGHVQSTGHKPVLEKELEADAQAFIRVE